MQKDDLPDPLGPLIMHVNGALNFISSIIGGGGVPSCRHHNDLNLEEMSTPHLYANGRDVSSLRRRRLKNETLYILSSG